MAQLLLYKNFSKRKNSTKQPESADYTLNIKTKLPVSIQNPVFTLSTVDLEVNYCKWENHYYFVDDIQLNYEGMYELQCSMDELASHKTEIGNSTQNLIRWPFTTSLVNDGIYYPMQNIANVDTATTDLSFINTSGLYIVRIAGIPHPYIMTPAQYNEFCIKLHTYSALTSIINLIIIVIWTPFSDEYLTLSDETFEVIVGLLETGIMCKVATRTFTLINNSITAKPSLYFNDNRDYDPRITHTMLRVFGTNITVPTEYLRNLASLKFDMSYDIYTGQATIDIKCNGAVFNTFYKNIGIPIQMSSINANLGSIASTLAGGAIGAVATIASATTGNEIGAMAGAISTAVNAASSSANQLINQRGEVSGAAGSFADVRYYNKIYYTAFRYTTNEVNHSLVGYACGDVRRINTMTGFIQCSNASLDIPSFGGDKERIEAYMNSGFFYE